MIANVFDSNTITQCHYAIDYGTSTDNDYTGTLPTNNGGLSQNILWDNFASSDGSAVADWVYQNHDASPDTDTSPFLFEVNNTWQLFERYIYAVDADTW